MAWFQVGGGVGALVELPENADWSASIGLLGSVFPISESERLFMGARHCLPEPPTRAGIMIWRGEQLVRALVLEDGDVEGQPDVVVLRADDGVPPVAGFATNWSEPPVWLDGRRRAMPRTRS